MSSVDKVDSAGNTVDKWGVKEIYKTKSGEISWYINDNANNSDVTIHELKGSITKKVDRGFNYFSAPVALGGLASGGSRPTFRIDVRASGEKNGNQKYNYKNGAVEHGYLWAQNDIGDSEYTIIARRRGLHGDHYVDFNIRGGDHHDSSPDSSCFQTLYPTQVIKAGTTKSMFAKEFIHSVFDHFTSTAKVTTKGWPENTWMGFKCVTYVSNASKREVTNRLYYDPDPIDFTQNPPKFKNNYIFVSEYIDKVGDTGNYDIPATWRGCTWSIRIDNADFIDFACVSLRSIEPTINPTGGPNDGGGDGGGNNGGGGGTDPPPDPDPGDGGSNGGGGTISTIPILAQPQSTMIKDSGGSLIKKPYVWFIFWGSDWDTRTTPFSKTDVMNKMTTLFGTPYFDSLFQYRFLKRPVLLGSSTNTTVTVPSPTYGYLDIYNVVQKEISKLPAGITKTTSATGIGANDVIFVVYTPNGSTPTLSELPAVGGHVFDDLNVWAFIDYNTTLDLQTFTTTQELVNTITDNIPFDDEGFVTDPIADENGDPTANEIADICTSAATVAGVNVSTYWSNEDNACIAPSIYPAFISCHTGATWNPVTQACEVGAVDNPGGGIDDGGGIPIPNPPPPPPNQPPVYVPSILTNPKGNELLDNGGIIPTQLSVYLIFWGVEWNSGTPLTNKTAIMADMTTLFKTYYFDHIYQYRRTKRPILAGMVTNTTYAEVDNYTATNATALIDNCKSTGLIPSTVDATKTLFIILNTDNINPQGAVNIDKDHFKDTYIWGYVNYHSNVDFWDQDLTNLIVNTATDTDPPSGFVLKSNDKFPGHVEGVDELTEICSTTADVNGVSTRRYWSNFDNACIAKNTPPAFIKCPTGSTWHPDIQECVVDVNSNPGGGGGDDGGGSGGSGGGPVEGPPFGGSDLPPIVNGKPVTNSILATPPVRYFADKGGSLENPLQVIFIFWGAEWNDSTTAGVSKDMIVSHMMAVFNSNYFDGLYQYRKIKRPEYLGAVVNTTTPQVSNYKHQDIVNVVNDSVARQLVPQNEVGQKNNIVHFVISGTGKYFNAPPSTTDGSFVAAGHSWNEITSGTTSPYHIIGWALKPPPAYALIDATEWITHSLIGICSDTKPETGIILSNTGTATTLTQPMFATVSPTKPPTLAKPKTTEVIFNGGPQFNGPIEFHFVFCGSLWNSTYSSLKSQITNDINTIFKSSYFDHLIQYGIKRPIIGSIVTATGHPMPDFFDNPQVYQVMSDCMDDNIIPFDGTKDMGFRAYYMLPTPNIRAYSDTVGGWHSSNTYGDGTKVIGHLVWGVNIWGASTYDEQTVFLTHEIVEICTDNLPSGGYTCNPKGKFKNLAKTLGLELCDVCDNVDQDNWGGPVAGVTVSKYWSDQTGSCTAPSIKPKFISCPTGYTWNDATQQCISNSGAGDGNGDDGSDGGNPPPAQGPDSDGIPPHPILATKKSINVIRGAGLQQLKLEVYVILASPLFDTGGTNALLANKLNADLPALFEGPYFDYLIQYGLTKRPSLKAVTQVSTPTLANNFTNTALNTYIDALITQGTVPSNSASKHSIAYLIISPPGVAGATSSIGFHISAAKGSGTSAYNQITGWSSTDSTTYATTTQNIAAVMANMIADNFPVTGYHIDPTGALASKVTSFGPDVVDVCSDKPTGIIGGLTVKPYWSDQDNACMLSSTSSPPWVSCAAGYHWDPVTQTCVANTTGGGGGGGDGNPPPPPPPSHGGPELCDACIGRSDGKGYISDDDDKVSVVAYWSDQDNACITSSSSPKWITCPAGSTWDPKIQECVLDASNDGSGGSDDGSGGGEGSGGGGLDDPTGGNGGTGDDTEPPPLVAVSRDWTFRLDVGVNSADSCTIGNPSEDRPFVDFYDVQADSSNKAFEDLGYNYGNGIVEIGVYVNTDQSILYNKVFRRVEVAAIKRIIDDNGDTCKGFISCAIIQFPERRIVAWMGDDVNVEGIDLNYQTIAFENPGQDYPLGVNDAIVLMYSDDSASADRCVRVKRTTKDTVDSINSFMLIRNANGYFVDDDLDFAWKLSL